MRDYIRSWMDVDEEDIPDSLLNPLLDEGAQRIADASSSWPWLRTTWTGNFVAATAASGVDLSAGGSPVEQITVVLNSDDKVLDYFGHDYALRADWTASSTPTKWSWAGDRLYLWPTPSSDMTVTVHGWRQMTTAWSSESGAEPDCPADFHSLIRTWALRGAYLQQDDPETASVWAQEFEAGLQGKLNSSFRAPSPPQLVLSGASSPLPSHPLQRLLGV